MPGNDKKILDREAMKALRQKFDDKYVIEGEYSPETTVGLADNLTSRLALSDNSPYLFRTAGGSLEIGSNCYEKAVVGGSVVFNQQADYYGRTNVDGIDWTVVEKNIVRLNGTNESTWDYSYYRTPIRQMNIPANHKVYVSGFDGKGKITLTFLGLSYQGAVTAITTETIVNPSYGVAYTSMAISANTTFDNEDFVFPQFFDLTQMFGSEIADYIYSLEQGQSGAGVAWFKRYFPKSYYPYTAQPYFLNVQTTGKKVVGFNQLDLEHLTKLNPTGVSGTDGYISNLADNTYIGHYAASNYWWSDTDDLVSTTANSITVDSQGKWYSVGLVKKVIPSQTYYLNFPAYSSSATGIRPRVALYDYNGFYIREAELYTSNANPTFIHTFSTPSNCQYAVIAFVPNVASMGEYTVSDINLSLRWDGERDGDVEACESFTYPVQNIELRGIPKLDIDNNLYYDGDVYSSDGTIERRFGIVDLGTLTWSVSSPNFVSSIIEGIAIPLSTTTVANAMCSKYTMVSIAKSFVEYDVAVNEQGKLYVRDTSYSSAEDFRTAVSGVYLVYELATPVAETAAPFIESQKVSNWGTEEYLDNRAIPLLVGHITEYLPDLKAKLEVAPESPDADGLYLMKRENGSNSYVSLLDSDDDVKSILDLDNVVNTGDSDSPVQPGTTGSDKKFTAGGAYTELAKKQNTLVSGQNIKTVNGQSIVGSGNAELPSYKAFKQAWRTTGTINQLLSDIADDSSVIKGDAYLGQVSLSDMPPTGTADIIVTVVELLPASKVLTVMLTSGVTAPYMWTYTYVNGAVSGWISYTLANNSITPGTHTKITYDSKGLVTAGASLVESDIPTLSESKISGLQTDLANRVNVKPDGLNNLIDNNNKVNEVYIPDSILGQLINGGVITVISGGTATVSLTDAAKYKLGTTSNSISLTNNTAPITGYTANNNIYYVSNVAGTFAGLDIQVGDWLVTVSTGWSKVDNTDAVSSVNGKTGAVQLQISDIPGLQDALSAAGQVDDVQINGTSVVANKVANITADTAVTEDSTNLVQSGAVFNAIKASEQSSIVLDHAVGAYDGVLTVALTNSSTPFSGISFEVDDTKTISEVVVGFGSGSASKTYVLYDLTNNVDVNATKQNTADASVKSFSFNLTGATLVGIGIQDAAAGSTFKVKTITVNYTDETNQTVTLDDVSAVNSTLDLVDKFVYKNVGLHIPLVVYDATQGYELVVEKILDSTYYKIVSDLPFNAYVVCWNEKYGGQDLSPVRGLFGDDSVSYLGTGFRSPLRQSLDEKYWVGPY